MLKDYLSLLVFYEWFTLFYASTLKLLFAAGDFCYFKGNLTSSTVKALNEGFIMKSVFNPTLQV